MALEGLVWTFGGLVPFPEINEKGNPTINTYVELLTAQNHPI